ncbi:diguanylate cyclase [Luminiphilus syltensis NOR5-1B]|uniref:diguanylate cyclase n=1 Tax=Luminiphilus syltensis NOR5-1B TaxID=565045 RepID=B8KTK3_9GAMM|nr:GGDEF domain-containing protein [Luminiphilus syltensis]EED35411.1 diguanylate cyclase [Luminiphilus syltensis NOR5-1B]
MKNIVSIEGSPDSVGCGIAVEDLGAKAMAQLLDLHENTATADNRNQLLNQFYSWAHQLKLADGAHYSGPGEKPHWTAGTQCQHSSSHQLVVQGVMLGTVTLSRQEHYGASELAILERAALCVSKGLRLFDRLDKLEASSSHDPLTGLLNRTALDEHLDREIARALRHGSRLSLMLLDADNFKEINDQLGHLVGDHVLRTLADLMRAECRETDAVYRLGGDEFVILLPETGRDQAIFAARRLRNRLAHQPASSYFLDAEDEGFIVRQPPRFSIGVAELDPAHPSKESLINEADAQMYRAKAKGTGRVE